ncbi:hypothetical protein BAUCODRAFT_313506 [Baudoinia panamericana UAMH 10762]|uniref:Glycosyltransferase family 8 protein n=1 Tax=Baudoinia panamericana (strain UAMH 10762) TaxID=717646 RepID=M2M3F2_BAUPA|nr:uncharacterized protein BAUCODRAFT_313506 [Baudoinia panamericana UAMH 10762]EMC91056.1 hypothetical protein BAUCODRAFT_313506 [Baudoinia panamericana UAMH 10762]
MRLSPTTVAGLCLALSVLFFAFLNFDRLSEPGTYLLRGHSRQIEVEAVEAAMAHQAEKHRLENALNAAEAKAEAAAAAAKHAEDEKQRTAQQQKESFAYVFYATSNEYACSALVNIHRLRNVLDSEIPIHLLVSDGVTQSYRRAAQTLGVGVHAEEAPPIAGGMSGSYYQDCMLKLLAFKMHTLDPKLKRVLAFDSDQLIMRNLDPLFTGLPPIDLAAPRAYWLAKDFLASTFMMISLSDRLWKTVKQALDKVEYDKFDMDLVNDLLGDSVMMLSGEYVTLNSHWEDWNLPRWYHAESELNMTTIDLINQLHAAPAAVPQDVGVPTVASAQEVKSSMTDVDFIPVKRQGTATKIKVEGVTNTAHAPDPSHTTATSTSPKVQAASQTPTPRFPETHPLTEELTRLQSAAAVIHFTAQGKPWMKLPADVRAARPDAHPLLAEQFRLWRETAALVCPGGIPEAQRTKGETSRNGVGQV